VCGEREGRRGGGSRSNHSAITSPSWCVLARNSVFGRVSPMCPCPLLLGPAVLYLALKQVACAVAGCLHAPLPSTRRPLRWRYVVEPLILQVSCGVQASHCTVVSCLRACACPLLVIAVRGGRHQECPGGPRLSLGDATEPYAGPAKRVHPPHNGPSTAHWQETVQSGGADAECAPSRIHQLGHQCIITT
jgi:hypothetical protein